MKISSRNVVEGTARAPHRAMYKAMGFNKRNNTYPQLTDHYFTGDYPVEIIDELGENKITQLSLLSTGSNS